MFPHQILMKCNVLLCLSMAFSPQFPPNSPKTLPPKNPQRHNLYVNFTSHNSLLNLSDYKMMFAKDVISVKKIKYRPWQRLRAAPQFVDYRMPRPFYVFLPKSEKVRNSNVLLKCDLLRKTMFLRKSEVLRKGNFSGICKHFLSMFQAFFKHLFPFVRFF